MLLKPKFLIVSVLIFIISFIALSFFVDVHPILPLDIEISLLVQRYQANWLDKAMLAISFFGELPYSLLFIVIIAALFYFNKYKREAYFITSILVSGLIILGVKNLINRPRPTTQYVRLVEINRFQSYPSGHVLSYVLFFGFLIILMSTLKNIPNGIRKSVTCISLFLVLTIAPSRIYLGAHWFTDTLGGFLLAIICLFPLCYFYFRRNKQSTDFQS